MRKHIPDTVSITDFNRGKAGKIFDDVSKNGVTVVLKNNKPNCVLISVKEYEKMMNELEDLKITVLAAERLLNHNPSDKTYSFKEVLKENGLSEKDLDGFEDIELD